MPELLTTLESYREQKDQDRKFMAAIQGIDIDGGEESKEAREFDEVRKRANMKARGKDPDANDVVDLQGELANQEGFGINVDQGLVYEVE